MTYNYEQLTPQRFQQLCQALILESFPHAQCLPVDQADGGRDAFQRTESAARSKPLIVFQAKFYAKALAEKHPHTWLKTKLNEEKRSLQQLRRVGMQQYIIATNVPGTATPQTGSIDSVQALLDETISVPAQCWWRDDLDRRLERSPAVKWHYPEILSGRDVIAAILTNALSEDSERRDVALRAYLSYQMRVDEEVRFKQVELQNNLFDLFIDIPLNPSPLGIRRDFETLELMYHLADEEYEYDPKSQSDRVFNHLPHSATGLGIGAASFLLRAKIQNRIHRLVLEGAPGQGKSTIGQYLCQIHRIRLLNRSEQFDRIPADHLAAPIRLPLKVDLRDLAVWLGGHDPFVIDQSGRPTTWHPTLESFLAAQISHLSGGATFSVSDLQAVAKVSHLLIVLDGFDEVADVGGRREVVDAITKAADRLEEVAASVQIIITSRPAAFANSPGFPRKAFPHFELASVTKEQAIEYAQKWTRARGLIEQERSEFIRTLEGKLQEPHLRELARNPMQLAILLSLVLTQGSSLPDKRTAMYDNYIGVFFGREAEKSAVVREHRELLVDIHRFLAWQLHTEAEESATRGSITKDRLQGVLGEYLRKEGHDVKLVEQLFTGMVERVVALVSRVEGTFEFEVQPLREYFAARHLYETAPYSPPGGEKPGTKPERFEAMARNFFWLNVTRFYAGCFSRGELASLVDSLEDLVDSEGYRYVSYPRKLCRMLLGDWVFSQQPKIVTAVMNLMADRNGLRLLLASFSPLHANIDLIQLPERCGRRLLIGKCFAELEGDPRPDYRRSLCRLIGANTSSEETVTLWLAQWDKEKSRYQRAEWLQTGSILRVFEGQPGLAKEAFENVGEDSDSIKFILRGGGESYFEQDEGRFRRALDVVISDESLQFSLPRASGGVLGLLRVALDPRCYTMHSGGIDGMSIADLMARYYDFSFDVKGMLDRSNSAASTDDRVVELVQGLWEEWHRPMGDWRDSPEPWNRVVELSRRLGGNSWQAFCLANAGAGVVVLPRAGEDKRYVDLFDEGAPLFERIRTARRSRAVGWWRTCLSVVDEWHNKMALAVLLSWGTPQILRTVQAELDRRLEELDARSWEQVFKALRQSVGCRRSPGADFKAEWLSRDIGARMAVACAMRSSRREALRIYERCLAQYGGDDRTVWTFCQERAVERVCKEPHEWHQTLRILRRSYAEGVVAHPELYVEYLRGGTEERRMPLEIATQICASPYQYPLFMITAAEARQTAEVRSHVRPVGQIAREKGWFGDG
jgi:hypothetical protein